MSELPSMIGAAVDLEVTHLLPASKAESYPATLVEEADRDFLVLDRGGESPHLRLDF